MMSVAAGRGGGGGGGAVKKLTISNFQAPPRLPDGYGEALWARLQAAVRAIQDQQPTAASNEELYRGTHKAGWRHGRDRFSRAGG
jgi:hypothetical protein